MAGAIRARILASTCKCEKPGRIGSNILARLRVRATPGTPRFPDNKGRYKTAGWRSGLAGASPPRVGELAPRNLRQKRRYGLSGVGGILGISIPLRTAAPEQAIRIALTLK